MRICISSSVSLHVGDTALIFASNQTEYRAFFCFPLCFSQGLRVCRKVPTFIFLLNLQGISVTVAMILQGFFLSFTANTCLYLFKSKHQKQGPKIFWNKHLTASEPAGVRLGRFPHISQDRIAYMQYWNPRGLQSRKETCSPQLNGCFAGARVAPPRQAGMFRSQEPHGRCCWGGHRVLWAPPPGHLVPRTRARAQWGQQPPLLLRQADVLKHTS